MSDKLIQLGISHLHEIWYMSQGADPVTSPYLYEYNILRFIKQKITRYFLSPSAFKVTINQLPFNTEHLDDYLWLKSLDLVLNNSRTRFELINQAHTNDNSSLFVGSLKEFINNQYNNIIDPIFRDITSIILLLQKKKKWSLTHYNEFNDLLGRFKKEYFEDYQDALQPFINRIEAIVNQNYNAQNNIKRAIEEKANFLSLAGMELWALPELLKDAKHIEVLELRDNNLSGLPDFITELSNLRNIDLSLNNFTAFPSVLLEFKHLARLDLSGNDMLKWDFYIADSKEKILEMSRQDLMVKNRYIESILNEVNQHLSIKDANKAIYVLKQIYGDIQQLGYENELVGLESRFNVYEKDYLVKGTVASAVWIEEHHSIIRGVELLVSNLRKDLFSNP
ncbi:MAG: hypothetical protein IPN33_16805 [Saprospiraceae bacterium]|nr:hypothetical protein [Saprospiraceae bacterium]